MTTFEELRKSSGFKTQQQLADALTIEKSTVSKWENGFFPTVERLLVLKPILNKSTDEILSSIMSSKKEKNTSRPPRQSADVSLSD